MSAARRKPKARGYTCSRCPNTITVVGPDSRVQAALRRVDWSREGGVAVCRTCNRTAS